MRAYERFLRYVSVHTTSDPASETFPSAERELDLAKMLANDMREIGMEDVDVDSYGYVYGFLSATPGMEQLPPLGFIAHMDTSPEASGEHIRPQLIEHYDGGPVTLPGTGDVLDPEAFPGLRKLAGMTLITTDGTTLLGADDKAGIAEILTACQQLISSRIPHGRICVAFTPDEEIGRGVEHFDLEHFGALYAYTIDGGEEGEISYETFNAARATVRISGLSVHPGSSKGRMINASLLAMEYNALLPAAEIPRCTENYEGFFHLTSMSGSCEKAELNYIIRDHDSALFEHRKGQLRKAAAILNERYGREVVCVETADTYYNMREKILPHFHLVEHAQAAVLQAGMTPRIEPVRGGTDGCQLSYKGLPTPNLCTGGAAFHGRFEHIAAESMDRCTRMILLLMTEQSPRVE